MSKLPIPEEIAAATVEVCAAWIDARARDGCDETSQEALGALAEALRFDRTAIVAAVTTPSE